MTPLARTHPVQTLFGELVLQEQLAMRGRQLTFAVIARDCIEWAVETRDVLREIARDAGNGEALVDEVARDGRITPVETGQLRGMFQEIGFEAVEGKIV